MTSPELDSWVSLNGTILTLSEARLLELLEEERTQRCRRQFLMRVHSRLNKLRADRERRELASISTLVPKNKIYP